MKYLSDLLYVDIDTYGWKGRNATYELYITTPYLEWQVEASPLMRYKETLIYTGNIYGTGYRQKVYLNDIIVSHVYDNSYVYNHIDNQPEYAHYQISSPVLFTCHVKCAGRTYDVANGDLIMNYYRDANTVAYNNILPLSTDYIPISYNPLMQRTTVLPHIPRLPYSTDKFWVSGMLISNIGWMAANATTDGETRFMITGYKDDAITTNSPLTLYTEALINTITLKNDLYSDIVSEADKLVFTGFPSDFDDRPVIPFAVVDECPADYYLIWIDRTGAYQCQPFNGKNTLSESVSTDYITNLTDEQKVSKKHITNQWTLNSGWLTEEQYKAFESIFSSKYLYLFNTQYDDGHEVILETNKWTEKTVKNRDKMYNLSISVKSSKPQNITY